MNGRQDILENERRGFEFDSRIRSTLANKLGLENLSSGNTVIRDERGFRSNEKIIDYIWLAKISVSFKGWCGLFAIRYLENNFRDTQNPSELERGIFNWEPDGTVNSLHIEKNDVNFSDSIKDGSKLDLFSANPGITLDGVSYEYTVIGRNIESSIKVNNPTNDDWKKWAMEVWKLGARLADESNIKELNEIFE